MSIPAQYFFFSNVSLKADFVILFDNLLNRPAENYNCFQSIHGHKNTINKSVMIFQMKGSSVGIFLTTIWNTFNQNKRDYP